MMKNKLGLINDIPNDEKLIFKFLNWMEKNRVDYTNTFLYLMNSQNNNDAHYFPFASNIIRCKEFSIEFPVGRKFGGFL